MVSFSFSTIPFCPFRFIFIPFLFFRTILFLFCFHFATFFLLCFAFFYLTICHSCHGEVDTSSKNDYMKHIQKATTTNGSGLRFICTCQKYEHFLRMKSQWTWKISSDIAYSPIFQSPSLRLTIPIGVVLLNSSDCCKRHGSFGLIKFDRIFFQGQFILIPLLWHLVFFPANRMCRAFHVVHRSHNNAIHLNCPAGGLLPIWVSLSVTCVLTSSYLFYIRTLALYRI